MARRVSLLIGLAGLLAAQTYTGSIRGRVSDPTGLPVADAVVTVTEVNTNAVRSTATNGAGDYVVSFLKPGDYRIDIGRGVQTGDPKRAAPATEPIDDGGPGAGTRAGE
jgi:protocatechuate 3,4-dioxygenase beta subunit